MYSGKAKYLFEKVLLRRAEEVGVLPCFMLFAIMLTRGMAATWESMIENLKK